VITQKQIDYVQKMWDDHAELNNEEPDVEVYKRRGTMYARYRHRVTGKMLHSHVPPSVYMHIDWQKNIHNSSNP